MAGYRKKGDYNGKVDGHIGMVWGFMFVVFVVIFYRAKRLWMVKNDYFLGFCGKYLFGLGGVSGGAQRFLRCGVVKKGDLGR